LIVTIQINELELELKVTNKC